MLLLPSFTDSSVVLMDTSNKAGQYPSNTSILMNVMYYGNNAHSPKFQKYVTFVGG